MLAARFVPWRSFAGILVLGAIAESGSHDFRNPARSRLLWDGHHITHRAEVCVQGWKIAAFGKDLKLRAGIPEIDGTGDTILPGLIDAHTHSYSRNGLQEELIFGVTTELGMENDPGFCSFPLSKRDQASGKAVLLWPTCSAAGSGRQRCPADTGQRGGAHVPTLTRPDEASSDLLTLVAPKAPIT